MGLPEGPQLPGNTGIAGPQAPPANAPPVEVPKDGFVTDPGNMPATTMLNGETSPTFQPVSNLVPNLNHINELGEIPMRFAADSALLRSQLLSPGLPQTEQVERNFQFFVAYAERFVEIARPLEAKAELTHQDDPNGKMPRQPPGEKGEKAPPSVPPGPEDGGVFTRGPDGRFPVPHSPEGHVPIPVDGHPIPEGDLPLPEGQPPQGPGDGRVLPDGKLPAPPLPRMDEPSYPGANGMFQVIEQQEPTAPPMKFYTPEQVQENVREFTRALQDSGFTQIRDVRSGKDGVELARDLLNARSPQEVEQKAKEIVVRYDAPPPPPDEAQTPRERNQQAITRELPLEPVRDLASDAARGVDPRRGVELGTSRGMQPMIDGGFALPPSQMPTRELETPDGRHDRHGYSTKRLGARMLWNVLHTFRRTGSDTATEDAKWDRITFGAMLFLGGVMVGVIILVSLYV